MVENTFIGQPSEFGFYMPAEWHPHDCTWVSWPHNGDTWSKNLSQAQTEFISFVAKIATDEPVIVLIPSETEADRFNKLFLNFRDHNPDPPQMNIWTNQIPTNDAWIRDYGPTFAIGNEKLLAVDWQYNAWGGKYPPFDDDQKVVSRALQHLPPFANKCSPVIHKVSNLCIEGGALEIDDNKILMCTRSCAMDPNRNADWTIDEIENELKACLGVQHTIWLTGNAIAGDDTDGHIDQLARFVPGRKIVHATAASDSDPQADALHQNLSELNEALTTIGIDYELIPLPLPEPVSFGSMRLPASYCNFYITNNRVIVPQFGQDKSDRQALEIISDLFPDRTTMGSSSFHLTVGLGSFHCLTQQQPAVL